MRAALASLRRYCRVYKGEQRKKEKNKKTPEIEHISLIRTSPNCTLAMNSLPPLVSPAGGSQAVEEGEKGTAMAGPFVGVWRRTHLFSPTTQLVDDTSLVLWVQSRDYFVDIRLPQGPHSLAARKAFAGIGRYEPASRRFSWTRLVDYQPPSVYPDVGLMAYDPASPDVLIEDGVDGDDYRERWVRIEIPAADDAAAISGQRRSSDGSIAVCIGSFAAVAVPRTKFPHLFDHVAPGAYSDIGTLCASMGVDLASACMDLVVCVGKDDLIQWSTVDPMVGHRFTTSFPGLFPS